MHDKFKNILSTNRPALVDNINSDGNLLNLLESKNVLTRRQQISISRLTDPFKKTEAVLDALYRRPDEDFEKFCEALKEDNQKFIVETYLHVDLSKNTEEGESFYEQLGIQTRNSFSRQGSRHSNSQNEESRTGGREESRIPNGHSKIVPSLINNIAELNCDQTLDRNEEKAPKFIDVNFIDVRLSTLEFYHSKKNESYPMNRRCRGRCVIINIYNPNGGGYDRSDVGYRSGAEQDEIILTKLFTELRFSVEIHRNLTALAMTNLMSEIVVDPHLSEDQSFVLIVMSHGSIELRDGVLSEVVYASDNRAIVTSQLLEPLARCKALAGKPKLAFFQACRGDDFDHGFTQTDGITETDSRPDKDEDETDAMPSHVVSLQDFIIGFPTQRGFRSFRNTKIGSWYINAIVQVFSEHACTMDVSAMLRKVNGIVSQWLPHSNDPQMQGKCQISSITDTLTKPYLYLFPGIEEEN